MKLTITRMYVGLLLCLFFAAGAVRAGERTVTVFEGRKISVSFPEGWLLEETRDSSKAVQIVRVVNPKSEVLLDMSFFPDPQGQLATIDRLKGTMKGKYGSYLAGSVEKDMKITSFAGPGGVGAYTSFTDRRFVGQTIPDSERLISTAGLLSWKGAYLAFTLLSNSRETDDYRQAFEIVHSGVRELPGQEVPPPGPQGFTVRNAPWVLKLPGTGATVREQKVNPDGTSGFFSVTDRVTGLDVTFFIEPAVECASSQECAAVVLGRGFADVGEVRDIGTSEIDGVSVVECSLPEGESSGVVQRHVFAEFVEQGYWVDMHLSKPRYKPADHELFEGFIRAVSFVQKGSGK
jgi:hypothetical protein